MAEERFDFSAETVWANIPAQAREGILAAVWCGR